MVGGDGAVILPPAGQGKCAGDRLGVHRTLVQGNGQRDFGPKLRLDAKQSQDMGIRCQPVGALLGQTSHRRGAEVVGRTGRLQITDFNMGLLKGRLMEHSNKQSGPGLLEQRVVP